MKKRILFLLFLGMLLNDQVCGSASEPQNQDSVEEAEVGAVDLSDTPKRSGDLSRSASTPNFEAFSPIITEKDAAALKQKREKILQESPVDSEKLKEIKDEIEALKQKFGFEKIKLQNVEDKLIIDISYPSFLKYIKRRYSELRTHADKKLQQSLDNLIFSVKEIIRCDSLNDQFDYLFNCDFIVSDLKFKKNIRSEFEKILKNNTVQQRIKSLLILRKITDFRLEGEFDFEKLDRLLVRKMSQQETLRLKGGAFDPVHMQILVEEEVPSLNVITVPSANSTSQPYIKSSLLLHELTHAYHHVIKSPTRSHLPIQNLSWYYADSRMLLDPWSNHKVKEKFEELLKDNRTAADIINHIGQYMEGKMSNDSDNSLQQSNWTNLEEVLTIIGLAPIDLGDDERYWILDRQNESAEMNREQQRYRLFHNVMPSAGTNPLFEIMIKTLSQSDKKLYSYYEGTSLKAKEAEEDFLTTFNSIEYTPITYEVKEGITTIQKGDIVKEVASVVIPASVTAIEEDAFSEYDLLETVEFAGNSRLEVIGEGAFSKSGLKKIKIPKNVKIIDENAFATCKKLETVEFAENSILEVIGIDAFSKSGLKKIKIPKNVKVIDESAFAGCKKLETIEFEEGSILEKIGVTAFQQTGLTRIVIPKNVTTVDFWAFQGCNKLETVEFEKYSNIKTLNEGVFLSCQSLSRIFNIPLSLDSIGSDVFLIANLLK